MVALEYLSALQFSGTDAGEFLHSQLSADVLALSSGDSTLACYCEPKGRVLALMLVTRNQADYYVIMSTELLESVAKRMAIYVMRAQVTIKPLDDCSIIGLDSEDQDVGLADEVIITTVPVTNNRLMITRLETPRQTDPARQSAWKLADLESGITWLGSDTSGQFIPQMLGFDGLGAVNFKKGCYPGQEIVARTHYLGKLKRHPRLLCTTVMLSPKLLDKIQILSDGKTHDAVITDVALRKDGGCCLFVVTRMEPESVVESMEYLGQSVASAQA
jgi:folate-binding protein YgfZ